MPVPKRKVSKQRKRKRLTHYKISLPTIVQCPKCKMYIRPHHVCKHCGYYGGDRTHEVKEK